MHVQEIVSTVFSPPSHRNPQTRLYDDDLRTWISPYGVAPSRSASAFPASLETCTVPMAMKGKRETYPYSVSSPYSALPTANLLIYWTRCESTSEDDCVHPAMPDGRSQVGRTPMWRNIVTPAQIREPATSVHSSRAWHHLASTVRQETVRSSVSRGGGSLQRSRRIPTTALQWTQEVQERGLHRYQQRHIPRADERCHTRCFNSTVPFPHPQSVPMKFSSE